MRRNAVATQQFYVDLGKMIGGFRRVEGISAAELAKRIGVTARTMQRIETAEQPCPVHTLLAIAAELDLSLDFDLFPVTAEKRKSA